MEEVKKLFDLNVGLVLSGGGAKGAYEAGVFKALWELDIIRRVSVVSGTSIGTVNALMLAMNDNNIMDKSWASVSYSRFITNENKTRSLKLIELIKKAKSKEKEKSIVELIKENDIGLLSQSGVRNFIEEYVDLKIIKESKKTIYACAYNIDLQIPEYFKLNDYNEEEIIDISLASCSIPFVFKPIKIGDYKYADGGINNPKYSMQNADNVPIEPLKNHDLDVIIVVHLSNKQHIDKKNFQDVNVIEIYPSANLETFEGIGTLNLMTNSLNEHIELGYRDALTILAPMIIDMLKGKPLDKLIKKHEEYNAILLSKTRHFF